MMWDLQRVKTLKTQIRNCIRFYKIFDPGCCEHQGVKRVGWRLVIREQWVIEIGTWTKRTHCGRHGADIEPI